MKFILASEYHFTVIVQKTYNSYLLNVIDIYVNVNKCVKLKVVKVNVYLKLFHLIS